MKKNPAILISLVLSSVLFLQTEAQSLTGKQTESIKKEIDAFFQEMLIHAERLDYDKLSLSVDDTHSAGFFTNGKYYPRYSALIDDAKLNTRGISRQSISIREKKITVLSEKIVLMAVTGLARAALDDNREIAVNFHWSFVYEKINNNWKVVHSHQSTI